MLGLSAQLFLLLRAQIRILTLRTAVERSSVNPATIQKHPSGVGEILGGATSHTGVIMSTVLLLDTKNLTTVETGTH